MRSIPIEVSPQEVKRMLDTGEPVYLVDVREPHEHQAASIAGAELLPMRTVPNELAALKQKAAAAPLVIFCHHGIRSLQTVSWLRRQGIERCQSMSGGIDAWSLSIAPNVPRY